MILKKEAIEKLSNKLNFRFTGVEQDWSLEFADPERLKEFILFYKEEELNQDEKVALMALILSSYDDFLNLKDETQNGFEDEIRGMIISDPLNFIDLVNYWRLDNETNNEMLFKITPFVRQIRIPPLS